MLQVTDDHRRARIGRRHGLHPDHRYDAVATATTAMAALHATEPATPHLALHARVRALTVADVERALYDERTLVKVMAMRRTLFVVRRELLAALAGSAGRRVADGERRRLAKEASALDQQLGAKWIATASKEVVDRLTGCELSVRELRDALPHLGGTFTAAPGTKWSAEVSTMSRLLTILTAEGNVVRAHNAGHWRISRPRWTSMASWLGEELTPTDSQTGYAEVVRHWLWTFGPGTENDLAWWLGSTKTAVRTALADLDAQQVRLEDGSTGWVLRDDTADLEASPETEPWVALLPTLDPTTMGWRERGFYLDPAHTPYLFDAAGNGGTTLWANGRIVGCWVQDEQERVRPIVMEDLSPRARRLVDAEAARLDEFIGREHITNGVRPDHHLVRFPGDVTVGGEVTMPESPGGRG
jgi:hypothetical protein